MSLNLLPMKMNKIRSAILNNVSQKIASFNKLGQTPEPLGVGMETGRKDLIKILILNSGYKILIVFAEISHYITRQLWIGTSVVFIRMRYTIKFNILGLLEKDHYTYTNPFSMS